MLNFIRQVFWLTFLGVTMVAGLTYVVCWIRGTEWYFVNGSIVFWFICSLAVTMISAPEREE